MVLQLLFWFLSTVINYADIVTDICFLFRRAFDFRNEIEKVCYKGEREKYYKSLCDKRYIEKQCKTLGTIYGPIVA